MRKLFSKPPAALLAAALAFGAFTSAAQAATVDVAIKFVQNDQMHFELDFAYDDVAHSGARILGLNDLLSFAFRFTSGSASETLTKAQLKVWDGLDEANRLAASYFAYDTDKKMIVTTEDPYGMTLSKNNELALKLVRNEVGQTSYAVETPSNPSGLYKLAALDDDLDAFKGKFLVNAKKVERTIDTTPVTPSPVPLPAGGFLLIGALGGLALLRRKKSEAMPA